MGLSRKLAPLVVLAGSLLAPSAAVADLVTLTYSGTIRSVAADFDPLAGVVVGTRFTGTLTYDDDAIDRDSASNLGQYIYTNSTTPPLGAPLGFTLDLESGPDIGTSYDSLIQLLVQNDTPNAFFGQDLDSILLDQGTRIGGVDQAISIRSAFGLFDTTRTAFSSGAIPSSLSLSPFDIGAIQILDLRRPPGSEILLEASIDGLSFPGAAVPEPSSLALAGLGALTLAGVALRRRA